MIIFLMKGHDLLRSLVYIFDQLKIGKCVEVDEIEVIEGYLRRQII